MLDDEDSTASGVLVSAVGVNSVADVEVGEVPKEEATLDVNVAAELDDSPEAGSTCCEPPQFLPVGFPQPLPPATGHHSGSGSLGDQSGIGGEITSL